MDQGGEATVFSYNGAAQLLGENRAGLAVTNDYDPFGRRTVLALASDPSTLAGFA